MTCFERLNLHAIIPCSRVNGPGARLTVFFQGCARLCPGCFNPETHPFEPRIQITAREVFERHSRSVEGLTVSGGEPFMQPRGLLELLGAARERGLSTVVYTGFTYGEVAKDLRTAPALSLIDVLVDGPYDERRGERTLLARGSTNQKFYFLTGRYRLEDLYLPAKAEVTIGSDGSVTGSGFSRVLLPGSGQ